jgi:REP element-mobilizing transposase RayT
LGDITDGEMIFNECGKIVNDEWFKTAEIRKNVELSTDEFVAMPNHIHGIIWIIESDVGSRWHRDRTQEKFGKPVQEHAGRFFNILFTREFTVEEFSKVFAMLP